MSDWTDAFKPTPYTPPPVLSLASAPTLVIPWLKLIPYAGVAVLCFMLYSALADAREGQRREAELSAKLTIQGELHENQAKLDKIRSDIAAAETQRAAVLAEIATKSKQLAGAQADLKRLRAERDAKTQEAIRHDIESMPDAAQIDELRIVFPHLTLTEVPE